MKKITLSLLTIFCVTIAAFAQVTNSGTPKSWDRQALSSVEPIVLPKVDMEAIEAEDAVNDVKFNQPWRFGVETQVDYGIENAGVWDELPNGDRIWRINIISEGAKTMNFIFDQFYMPPGATVYLYNNDKTTLLGAYDSSLNREDMYLGTWTIEGENIWIEYHEPKSYKNQGKLNISKAVHGYRSVTTADLISKGLNDSGNCNLDVDCQIGSDFEDLKNQLKHSVALVIMGGFVCSGALINNANNDNAPYFLTANHCDVNNPATWSFRFNWISPNPVCAENQNSSNSGSNTTSGATKLATNPKSDVMLLNIDGNLSSSWQLTWAGWNRSTTDIPEFSVGIHHPSGDIMKVCRADQPPSKITTEFYGYPSAEMWYINNWDIGVTEQGSSGSPLFDQNGHIVGQLAGGTAECVGTNNNGGYDIYGRFDVSWDFGSSASTRLRDWLDPDDTGAMTVDILDTPDFQFISNLTIYPNPASDFIYIMNNNSSKLKYHLYNVQGKLVKKANIPEVNNTIRVNDLNEGIYFLRLEDGASQSSLTKKIIVNR